MFKSRYVNMEEKVVVESGKSGVLEEVEQLNYSKRLLMNDGGDERGVGFDDGDGSKQGSSR